MRVTKSEIIYAISMIMICMSACGDPIIYVLMNKNYRGAVRRMISQVKPEEPHTIISSTSSPTINTINTNRCYAMKM
ncbi:hypothetical protein B4U80_14157 [Leptotrombidium deliense]|uniref:Uncharacterized protein n=1 Tax=Leptotrombidium deliense TaxID=299467 RepID=A0A443S1D4_9ACAR|nr:hypothetical protein B4U80_14157 [Leptotrombidium deliense]